jgi:hypothetical protein
MTLLAAFCDLRTGELIDTLCDLLIDMVHRVAHRAEVRVEPELIADFKRVSGKNSLLFHIAEASLDHPDELVKEVVYLGRIASRYFHRRRYRRSHRPPHAGRITRCRARFSVNRRNAAPEAGAR